MRSDDRMVHVKRLLNAGKSVSPDSNRVIARLVELGKELDVHHHCYVMGKTAALRVEASRIRELATKGAYLTNKAGNPARRSLQEVLTFLGVS